jgi:hypothetical protein
MGRLKGGPSQYSITCGHARRELCFSFATGRSHGALLTIIFAAALGLILASLEFFLSDAQKIRLNDKVLFLWNWLSEAKEFPLLEWLRSHYKWIVGTALLLESIYVGWLVSSATSLDYSGPQDVVYVVGIGVVIAAVSLVCGLTIIRRTIFAASLPAALLRAFLFIILSLTLIRLSPLPTALKKTYAS